MAFYCKGALQLLLICSLSCVLHTSGSRIRHAGHKRTKETNVTAPQRVFTAPHDQTNAAYNKALVNSFRKAYNKSTTNESRASILKQAYDVIWFLPPLQMLQIPFVRKVLMMVGGDGGHTNITSTALAASPKTAEDHSLLMDIGGGIGAASDELSQPAQKDLLRRIRYQDQGLLVILALLYCCAIAFAASVIYHRVQNTSEVTYFCQPRRVDGHMCGRDTSEFLETFNRAPQATLQVSGWELVRRGTLYSFRWEGKYYRTAFAWSFDLSPWLTHAVLAESGNRVDGCAEGIYPEDLLKLEKYLSQEGNDLATVEIQKEVSWSGWEELATNIKQHIRQQGFTGIVSVQPNFTEVVTVQKNTPWANFIHAKSFFALCSASMFGLMVYLPYIWVRCTKVSVRSYHRVNIAISDYWPLIEDKLSAAIAGQSSQPPSTDIPTDALSTLLQTSPGGGHML